MGPYEIEWRRIHDEFFRGHEHLWVMDWEKNTIECIAPDCPGKEPTDAVADGGPAF